jgi:hypothetical protein
MDPELAAALDGLRATLAEMDARLRRLEGRPEVVEAPAPEASVPAGGPMVALVGRSLIVLGGAYLLRAATDHGLVPEWLGAILALVYAAALVVLADRAGSHASAGFHSGVALLVAGPLVDELAVRLHLVGPAGAAALAGAYAVALGVVSRRRQQPLLAWLGIIAVSLVAAALALQTQALVPCLWLVTALVVEAALLSQWALPSLPLTIGALLSIWLAETAAPGSDGALAALLGFFVAGVGAAWWSAAPEAVQVVEAGLLLPAVAVEGARLAQGRAWFGVALLVTAAGGFVLARTRRNFFRAYSLVVGLIALDVLASGGVLAAFYLVLVGALLAVGSGMEVAVALLAAAAASGMLEFTVRALAFPTVTPPGTMALVVVAAAAVASALRPKSAVLLVLAAGVAGLLVWAGISLGAPSAAIRTSVLALMAVALALLSRNLRARAAGRWVYPFLVGAVLELLVDGMRVGTSATVFVGLAVCGMALIVAPRLRAAR